MNARIGKRVRITGGMPEFVGQTGTIIGVENYGGSGGAYYRVRFDEPVNVASVGLVEDDIWQGGFLKTICERRAAASYE